MRVEFAIPVQVPVNGVKTDLKAGTHEIDDVMSNHWFLTGLIKEGKAKIIQDVNPEQFIGEITIEEIKAEGETEVASAETSIEEIKEKPAKRTGKRS